MMRQHSLKRKRAFWGCYWCAIQVKNFSTIAVSSLQFCLFSAYLSSKSTLSFLLISTYSIFPLSSTNIGGFLLP